MKDEWEWRREMDKEAPATMQRKKKFFSFASLRLIKLRGVCLFKTGLSWGGFSSSFLALSSWGDCDWRMVIFVHPFTEKFPTSYFCMWKQKQKKKNEAFLYLSAPSPNTHSFPPLKCQFYTLHQILGLYLSHLIKRLEYRRKGKKRKEIVEKRGRKAGKNSLTWWWRLHEVHFARLLYGPVFKGKENRPGVHSTRHCCESENPCSSFILAAKGITKEQKVVCCQFLVLDITSIPRYRTLLDEKP